MKAITYVSIAAALATSSLALAMGGHGIGGRGMFAHWDRDGNGVISRDEARTTALEHFGRMDQNHDGRLVPGEIAAFGGEQAAKTFAEKDKNGDGKLSRDEVPNMPDKMFAHLDANGDGAISREEFAQGHDHMRKFAEARFAAADQNHDGVVTREEATAEVDRRFAELDTNGDGSLTPEEVKAGMRAHGWQGNHDESKTPGGR